MSRNGKGEAQCELCQGTTRKSLLGASSSSFLDKACQNGDDLGGHVLRRAKSSSAQVFSSHKR